VCGGNRFKLSSDLLNHKLQFFKRDIKYPGHLCIFLCICSCVCGGGVYCLALFCFLVPYIKPNKSFSDLKVRRELAELSPFLSCIYNLLGYSCVHLFVNLDGWL